MDRGLGMNRQNIEFERKKWSAACFGLQVDCMQVITNGQR